MRLPVLWFTVVGLLASTMALAQDAAAPPLLYEESPGTMFLSALPLRKTVHLVAEVRGAALGHRSLFNQEYGVFLAPSPQFDFYAGYQDFDARGNSSSSRFTTNAGHYGVRAQLLPVRNRNTRLAFAYDRLEVSTGRADLTGVTAEYRGLSVNTFTLVYSRPMQSQTAAPSHRPVLLHLGGLLSLVDAAADRRQTSLGLYGGAEFPSGNLITKTGFYFLSEDGDAGPRTKVLLGAGVSYRLFKQLHLEVNGFFGPDGLPVLGTSFSALSSFSVYRPGSAVLNQIQSDATGFLEVRLVGHF